MFLRRTREERRKNREEGYKQAIQEFSEWNTRRLEAEERGDTFTEPPPGQDVEPKKKDLSSSNTKPHITPLCDSDCYILGVLFLYLKGTFPIPFLQFFLYFSS